MKKKKKVTLGEGAAEQGGEGRTGKQLFFPFMCERKRERRKVFEREMQSGERQEKGVDIYNGGSSP